MFIANSSAIYISTFNCTSSFHKNVNREAQKIVRKFKKIVCMDWCLQITQKQGRSKKLHEIQKFNWTTNFQIYSLEGSGAPQKVRGRYIEKSPGVFWQPIGLPRVEGILLINLKLVFFKQFILN